jgi:hypothetical protein
MATLGTTAPKISGQVPYTPADYETAQKLYQQDTQRVGEQQDALMALREEERKSKSLFAEAESAQKVNVKKAGEEQTGKYLEDIQGRQKDYETKMSANPLPTHQPTQEDLSTYAQMGSLMMTMGLMLGAGGKANAKLGLDAMTGMMTGWKKGRQDLWKQEAINFDKAFNKIKADRETIYKNLQEGMKLAATNYAAAKEKFENAAWIAGQNSVIAHGIHTGNIQSVIKNMEDVNRVNNELKDKVRNIAMGFAQRREQKEEAERNRATMLEAARIKEQGKRETAEKKVGSIGKVAEGKLEAKSALVKQYDALIEDYETNKDKYQLSPGLRTALTLIPGGGSASEKIMSVARANPDKYPNAAALSQFIGKLESVIAPDRHSLYGANLTANELPRYERTVPRVTDDPKVFLQFLESNRKSAEDSLRSSQDFYARRGVDLRMDEIYDKAQPFIATRNGTPKFNTLQEAEAAGLPSGTKIIVGGRSATVE